MQNIDVSSYCDPDTKSDILQINRLSDKKMQVDVIENVYILPPNFNDLDGEVVTSDFKVVDGVNSNINYPREISINQEVSFSECDYCESPVIYLGTIFNCWGHFFTDGFSRMWYFLSREWEILKSQEPAVQILYVSPYSEIETTPQPWMNLINELGIKISITPITELRKYKKVILPSTSWFVNKNHREYTIEFSNVIDLLLNKVSPKIEKKYEKIYLSRRRWIHVNPDFGEKPIEKLFNKVGYLSVSPELFSVGEQLAIFQSAKSVVSTCGSLAHNAMFLTPGTELIILRKVVGSEDYQMAINQMKNLKVTYIDCHLSLFVTQNVNLGPFFIYVNQNLINFFRDKFSLKLKNNFSVKKYMRYVRLCLKKEDLYYRTPSYNEMSEFYFKKVAEEMNKQKSLTRLISDFLSNHGLSVLQMNLKKIYCKIMR